ncbi:11339_t:CDS:2, partial [Cetraspora pellucida]
MASAINVSTLKLKVEAKEIRSVIKLFNYTEATCAITDEPINEIIIENDQDDISHKPIYDTDNINHEPIYDTDSFVKESDTIEKHAKIVEIRDTIGQCAKLISVNSYEDKRHNG